MASSRGRSHGRYPSASVCTMARLVAVGTRTRDPITRAHLGPRNVGFSIRGKPNGRRGAGGGERIRQARDAVAGADSEQTGGRRICPSSGVYERRSGADTSRTAQLDTEQRYDPSQAVNTPRHACKRSPSLAAANRTTSVARTIGRCFSHFPDRGKQRPFN